MSNEATTPEFSIMIPVYNEEAIIETAVRGLISKLFGFEYELILAENGSTDHTADIARSLSQVYPHVRALHVDEPNYGLALRRGIETARGTYVICDEIDLGDVTFYTNAITLLRDGADMVIGSKRHPDSADYRPWIRRQGTAVINGLLRVTLDFKGTDTHGLKAFKRESLMPIVEQCVVEHDLFASELTIRAARAGLDVREIPISLHEIRPPSIALHKRVPRVLMNLGRLVYTIRLRSP